MIKDFINLADFSDEQLAGLLERAISDKQHFGGETSTAPLMHKTLAMVFEKPSNRTRVSFEVAMTQLGGHAIYLAQADIGLGSREPVRDVARVLGRMCDGICARTFSHRTVETLAEWAPVPVINSLSDYGHPCQAMADLMTAREHFGRLTGRTLAFIGDGNNVARSLAVACGKLGMNFILAAPEGYELDEEFVAAAAGGSYSLVRDPKEAVEAADVIYTDTWVSMGQEDRKQQRLKDFEGFQINAKLLAAGPKHAIVMHCMPAYRGCEISDETFEAHAETIFAEAENRLHFQRSLLNILIGEGGIR